LPCVPIFALVKANGSAAGTALTINGNALVTGVAPSQTSFDRYWYPAIVANEWLTFYNTDARGPSANNPAFINTPFGSSRSRIVSQAFRLYYTGSANNCSGLVTIMSDKMEFDEGSVTLNSQTILSPTAQTGTSNNILVGTVNTTTINVGTSPNILPDEAVMARSEVGANVLIPHASDSYRWVPTHPYNLVLQNSTALGAAYILSTGNQVTGVSSIDTDWDSALISITGAASGTTYRLECITCVEYEVMPSSPMYAMAKPQNTTSPSAIAAAAAVSKIRPLSIPLAKSESSFVNKALKIASSMAPAVGAFFGPAGIAIGGAFAAGASAAIDM
jgi:hypothetical protein